MGLEITTGLFGDYPVLWLVDVIGLAVLIGYHLYLRQVYHEQPERTYRGRSNRLRRAWVEMVRVHSNDILAVQTLRNWIMSATLLAST